MTATAWQLAASLVAIILAVGCSDAGSAGASGGTTGTGGHTGPASGGVSISSGEMPGGVAGTTGCVSTTIGIDTRVDYAAEYFFYKGGV